MKKFLLSMALFAASVGAWATDDAVTAKVSGTNLNVALTNETEYCAFQMDITLPSGVSASAVAAAANRLTQTGSDTEIGGTKFIVASNVIDETNNVLRVIAYNLNNNAIAGTSGADILNITLSAAPSKSSDVKVSNIVFVKSSDLTAATLSDATGVDGFKKGDVNQDGTVDVFDATALVNIILHKQAETTTSDVDGNGTIDVFDVTALTNIILHK